MPKTLNHLSHTILNKLSILFAFLEFNVFVYKNACARLVDYLRTNVFISPEFVPSPTLRTNFVPSLWVKESSFAQSLHRLLPLVFIKITSVNGALYPLSTDLTMTTTNILNIYKGEPA